MIWIDNRSGQRREIFCIDNLLVLFSFCILFSSVLWFFSFSFIGSTDWSFWVLNKVIQFSPKFFNNLLQLFEAAWRDHFDCIKNILNKNSVSQILFLFLYILAIFISFDWLLFPNSLFSLMSFTIIHFLRLYNLDSFFICPFSFL